MKTGTIITLLAVGGVGYLLYRQWKKTKLAVAAVAPAAVPVTAKEEMVRLLTTYYNMPYQEAQRWAQFVPVG